jgi:hypothetical protein
MEVTGQPHILASLAAEKHPLVPTENDERWAPETVMTYWRKEKYIEPQALSCPAISPVTVLAELSLLPGQMTSEINTI